MNKLIESVLTEYSLVTAFAVVGVLTWMSNGISVKCTRGRLHGSAIAIFLGLLLSLLGGWYYFRTTGKSGTKGLADIPAFAGIGVLGGSMLRDFSIVSTAMGVRLSELRNAGLAGVLSLAAGIFFSFLVGSAVAWSFGYRSAVDMTTIGAGSATFIVGPVTGAALHAGSDVIALSVAAGLVKAILVMIFTPFVAPFIGLDNPRTALIYGGLMGTTSGVAGGLAATDPKLVPYGAMTATFFTGLGCLLGPSLMFFLIRLIA